MSTQAHWQDVYARKAARETSWHRAHLDTSLALIDALHLPFDAPMIDVGAGRSNLVDDLLAREFRDLTVLDVADAALADTRTRLGAAPVRYVVADVLQAELPAAHYALWHDRAVFHFLRDAAQRDAYVAQATRAVRVNGYALVATFALDGPARCSNLEVCRYDASALARVFAPTFTLVEARSELHRTPWDTEQAFTYALLRRA